MDQDQQWTNIKSNYWSNTIPTTPTMEPTYQPSKPTLNQVNHQYLILIQVMHHLLILLQIVFLLYFYFYLFSFSKSNHSKKTQDSTIYSKSFRYIKMPLCFILFCFFVVLYNFSKSFQLFIQFSIEFLLSLCFFGI